MLMNPLPDIDTVFSMLIQQEREIGNFVIDSIVNDAPDRNSSNVLLANSYYGKYNSKGKGQNSGSKGGNRFCTYCKGTNHIVENCWIKHGYPIGYKGKGKNLSQSTQVNSVAAPNGVVPNSSLQLDSTTSSTKPLFGFTQEQYHGILGLFQQLQSQPSPASNSVSTSPLVFNSQSSNGNGKCSNLWILDTGATDHFTFDLSCFSTYQNIILMPISLPNGTQILASIAGTVIISHFLTLLNVLYIPSFHVNLISVSKIATTNNCVVNFTSHSCEILQNCTKAVIGIARLQRGLYVIGHEDPTGSNVPDFVGGLRVYVRLGLPQVFKEYDSFLPVNWIMLS
ncbi:unnamed protein product [Trifolium pratense]|uniref:Uncharacterized protein n=1 Tax=Trifolium pratense TaxID=57577 RepID=A0ACB0LBY8_TRIPR|nr:unnamed protein product [Trifolium pratense]